MPTLTITQILKQLVEALHHWGHGVKATVTIARDPFNVLEILAATPTGFRLVVHWVGDDNISDLDELPLSDNEIEVILSYNLGLTNRPDLTLIQGTPDRPPLYDLVDQLRAFVLAIRYPTNQTGSYLVYRGTKPYVTPDGIPLAAYRLTFHIQAAVNVNPAPFPI
jgi:hypothetical protein